MAYRTLEVTLISAKDLNDVNVFSKMDVYAVASIAGDQRSRQRTAADRVGGKSPSWNATLRFFVPAAADVAAGIVLHVLLRSERVLGDRDIGEVYIPLKELLDAASAAAGDNNSGHFVSYQVRKPSSGNSKGILNLSYSFVDVPDAPAAAPLVALYSPANETNFGYLDTAYQTVPAYPPPGAYLPAGTHLPPAASESKHGYPAGSSAGYPPPEKEGTESKAGGPITAYPYVAPAYPPYQVPYGYTPGMPLAGHGYGAPPLPVGYGYGAPPPPVGYGYGAPPPPGYGYGAPQAVQKPKKGMGKAGLGMGLLGGALGGLLIGDMMADVAEAGFCDGDDF